MPIRLPKIAPSEITPPEVFFNRRKLLAGALATGASALVQGAEAPPSGRALQYKRNPQWSVTEAPNKYEEITTYNNFYEFGTDKDEPAKNAATLRTAPWSVTVDGEAEVKGTFPLEDILKANPLEERVYRFRC